MDYKKIAYIIVISIFTIWLFISQLKNIYQHSSFSDPEQVTEIKYEIITSIQEGEIE